MLWRKARKGAAEKAFLRRPFRLWRGPEAELRIGCNPSHLLPDTDAPISINRTVVQVLEDEKSILRVWGV